MHLTVICFTIFSAWKWGDWKNWQKYHTTMLYIAMGNMLFNFFYHSHLLWQYKKSFLVVNHVAADTLTTFIILPLTALIFLTNYPDEFKQQLFRIIKFITIYFVVEIFYCIYGIIIYKYGWNIWWSLTWDCMMFPMLVLHHKKPLIAYGASIIVGIILLRLFPV
jgi:hypothetical protein